MLNWFLPIAAIHINSIRTLQKVQCRLLFFLGFRIEAICLDCEGNVSQKAKRAIASIVLIFLLLNQENLFQQLIRFTEELHIAHKY